MASAHDVVLNATPEDGSVVTEFPREIVLEFSGIPKEMFNTIAVSNADTKTVLFSAEPKHDKQFLSVKVPEDVQPGPGNYIVGFQITSSDGHATRGKTSFSVTEAPPTPPTPTETSPTMVEDEPVDPDADEAQPDESSEMSLGTVISLMAVVALIAGVIVTIKKRK